MTNHALSNRADLRERTKTMSRHGDRRGQIADFRDSFETISWLDLLFKCGIKTKTHFEWLLWHWSSLGQLNLEPTRPNGLVGCKVPTDLVKISVKEATHMGFCYTVRCVFCDLLIQPLQFTCRIGYRIFCSNWPWYNETRLCSYSHNTFSADSRLAPSKWETSLQSNAVATANLESATFHFHLRTSHKQFRGFRLHI